MKTIKIKVENSRKAYTHLYSKYESHKEIMNKYNQLNEGDALQIKIGRTFYFMDKDENYEEIPSNIQYYIDAYMER